MIPVSISIDNLSEGTKTTAPQEKNARMTTAKSTRPSVHAYDETN
jgi:hypothetical protein